MPSWSKPVFRGTFAGGTVKTTTRAAPITTSGGGSSPVFTSTATPVKTALPKVVVGSTPVNISPNIEKIPTGTVVEIPKTGSWVKTNIPIGSAGYKSVNVPGLRTGVTGAPSSSSSSIENVKKENLQKIAAAIKSIGGTPIIQTPIESKISSMARPSALPIGDKVAKYDRERGGVVTSDNKFFPTNNPSWMPKGYNIPKGMETVTSSTSTMLLGGLASGIEAKIGITPTVERPAVITPIVQKIGGVSPFEKMFGGVSSSSIGTSEIMNTNFKVDVLNNKIAQFSSDRKKPTYDIAREQELKTQREQLAADISLNQPGTDVDKVLSKVENINLLNELGVKTYDYGGAKKIAILGVRDTSKPILETPGVVDSTIPQYEISYTTPGKQVSAVSGTREAMIEQRRLQD